MARNPSRRTTAAEWTAIAATLFAPERRPRCQIVSRGVKLTIEQSLPGNLSPADWADLRELLSAIQEVLPDAANRPPGEVFRYALAALRDCPENARSSDGQLIEGT
jgi:hypothetical protein